MTRFLSKTFLLLALTTNGAAYAKDARSPAPDTGDKERITQMMEQIEDLRAEIKTLKIENEHELKGFHLELKEEFIEMKWEVLDTNMRDFVPIVLFVLVGGLIGVESRTRYLSKKNEKALKDISEKNEKALNSIVEGVKEEHREMMWASLRRASINIYTALSEKNEDLYRYLNPPLHGVTYDKHNPDHRAQLLYKNYLNFACDIAKKGYEEAVLFERSFAERDESPLLTYDKKLVVAALNNYVFYPGSRAAECDKGKTMIEALHKLEALIAAEKAAGDPLWWNHQATLIWAQLNLGYLKPHEAQSAMQALFDLEDPGEEWKESVIDDFERYNIMNRIKDTPEAIILAKDSRGPYEKAFPPPELL